MELDQETYAVQVVTGVGTAVLVPYVLRVRVGDLVRWELDQGSLKVVLPIEDENAVVFNEQASDGPGSSAPDGRKGTGSDAGGDIVQGTAAVAGVYSPAVIVWQAGRPPVNAVGILIIDP